MERWGILLLLPSLLVSATNYTLTEAENDDLQATCGKPPSDKFKSLHGYRVNLGAAPWAVSIVHAEDKWFPSVSSETYGEWSSVKCGGVIISPRHVITAASCFGVSDINYNTKTLEAVKYKNIARFMALAGATCGDQKTCDKRRKMEVPQQMEFAKVHIMSSYTGYRLTVGFDLAIIELKEPFDINKRVFPACLPKATGKPAVGSTLNMYGYGFDYGDKLNEYGELKHYDGTVTDCGFKSPNSSLFCVADEFQTPCLNEIGSGYMTDETELQKGKNQATVHGVLSHSTEKCTDSHVVAMDEPEPGFSVLAQGLHGHLRFICFYSGVCADGLQRKSLKKAEVDKVFQLLPLADEDFYAL